MIDRDIAYFSMEVGFDAAMPTYSGGLGVLAGDTIRAAADLSVPLIAVTLLHRQGYFKQILDADGNQSEAPCPWPIEEYLEPLDATASVVLEGDPVNIRAWRYEICGVTGYTIPIIYLDTDIPENSEDHRGLTHHLYGGDERYRLCQEAILGIGGIRILRTLGCDTIKRYHMNEGHASLLAFELLRRQLADPANDDPTPDQIEAVRRHCLFTTHTPVPAGHDKFPRPLVERVLSSADVALLDKGDFLNGDLNMTELALFYSRYVNGVARRHGEISRKMFKDENIDSITNGVHVRTWTSPPFAKLFDRHITTWREDSFSLRYALAIPADEVWNTHLAAKKRLCERIRLRTGVELDHSLFTIGFARRAATYKRADLFFHDLERLRRINGEVGPIQAVFSGKAHPADDGGKELIRRIVSAAGELSPDIRVVYLANYDFALCQLLVAGVDLWLNTPEPPLEASGTSGMKAAINGVPSLSILDGWWLEGWIEGITGWSIGQPVEVPDREADAKSLYGKLEHVILPMYYKRPEEFIRVMRHAIALNGSFFNTQRMMQQYVLKAYFA